MPRGGQANTNTDRHTPAHDGVKLFLGQFAHVFHRNVPFVIFDFHEIATKPLGYPASRAYRILDAVYAHKTSLVTPLTGFRPPESGSTEEASANSAG